MKLVFFLLQLSFMVFLIKFIMRWIYNIVFAVMKAPYFYIFLAFLFNIIAFEILNFFYSQATDTRIFNMYGVASIVALFFLIPPKNNILTKEEMSDYSDDVLGIKHSVVLYKIGIFAFFIGNIVGSYLIMYQDGINVLNTITIK